MNAKNPDTFDRSEERAPAAGRPWLGVQFSCTGAYLRVYRNADGVRYLARCPRCGKAVTFRVGEGGTADRFFVVNCGG